MRWIAVWRRNFLVWRKLFAAAVLTNLADPLIMLFGLGYGLGALMPAVEGMSYISFFAAGQLCTATMYTRPSSRCSRAFRACTARRPGMRSSTHRW